MFLLFILQAFVEGNGSCDDYSSQLYDVANVQAIALLDMRLLNCDRNDGNLLVQVQY